MKAETRFHKGDVIIVKPNVKDSDFGHDISGWQGRILTIENDTVHVSWDSVTLRNMQSSVIRKCEQEGLDWGSMYLSMNDIEHGKPRDTPADVKRITRRLQKEHYWDYVGEEGVRIQQVLKGIDPGNDWRCMKRWHKFLRAKLSHPFKAEVAEYQEYGPLRAGNCIEVLKILGVDDSYGVIVAVLHKHMVYQFPLCDLEVKDKTSPNYQPVKDYVVWFANR